MMEERASQYSPAMLPLKDEKHITEVVVRSGEEGVRGSEKVFRWKKTGCLRALVPCEEFGLYPVQQGSNGVF